jgi:hypothetical protein
MDEKTAGCKNYLSDTNLPDQGDERYRGDRSKIQTTGMGPKYSVGGK